MLDLPRSGTPLAIGHRGAAALAPENTLAALEAAVDAGVDAVEIDVIARSGSLVLGHSQRETSASPLPLDEALAWLAGRGVLAHVDVKGAGLEEAVVEAIRRADLLERAYVSTPRPASVRRFAELAPELARALSYPDDRLGVSRRRLGTPFVAGALRTLRRTLPYRIAGMLRDSRATAAALHHDLITRAAVERCHAAGAAVLAWTVDDAERIRELAALGVDGIVSDDPRLFASTLSP